MEVTNYATLAPTSASKKRLNSALVSWRKVYAHIRDMDDSEKNLKELSEMLALEMSNPDGGRHQILTRLHMRINAMRQRLEYAKVMKHAVR